MSHVVSSGLLMSVLLLLGSGCETTSQLEPLKPLGELNPGAELQLCRFTVDLLTSAPFAACTPAPPWSHDFDSCVAGPPWEPCGETHTVADWEACVLALNADPCGDTSACDEVRCPP